MNFLTGEGIATIARNREVRKNCEEKTSFYCCFSLPLEQARHNLWIKMMIMSENEISAIVLNEAIHIHRSIGPGMLESAYQHCLQHRLIKNGLQVRNEVPVPLVFEDVKLECGYRADLIIDNKVVVEVKSIDAIAPIHLAQTLTYLRLLNLKLGIVLNFNSILMKDGIKRIVNNL